MKILIIGSKGMLGQELAKVFADQQLTLWDREEIDITKPEEYGLKITEVGPDLIINAAAMNDVDGIEKDDSVAKLVNGSAVGSIADICSILGIFVVHYSSDYVFDGTKQGGYVEYDKPEPISKYGESKLLGERLLKQAATEYYLIRTSRLFGNQGAADGTKASFVDKIIAKAKEGGPLELVDEEVSSPTYVVDLAKRTREMLTTRKPFGIYHVTNSGACTWYQFGKKALELAGFGNVPVTPVPASTFERPAKRPAFSVLKNTKLPPMRPWEEALAEYLGKR
ncbi:MAG: dTDP-4-dehydrorhamnose reductase [Patescibacteria group bacterium]